MMRHIHLVAIFAVLAVIMHPQGTRAAGAISPIVYVVCDDRQGSGAYVSTADGGYVATVAHVAIGLPGDTASRECDVGFSDESGEPKSFYRATVVQAIYDRRTDRDLALLKLGTRLTGFDIKPLAPVLMTNEFAKVGDSMTINGYPGADTQRIVTSSGTVKSFGRGSLRTDAVISEGFSGGPLLDSQKRLIGLATRITFEVDDETGKETVLGYEGQDVLTLIDWLDESLGGHDAYIVHADSVAFHARPYMIRSEELGCSYIVRTPERPTLYCLSPGDLRFVFPNERTFFTWYQDYTNVFNMQTARISSYALIGNVTARAGSLVKITTDPSVYLVMNGIGTLRKVPDERTANAYFGAGWATLVRDVPDEFFIDYRVGRPLPTAL